MRRLLLILSLLIFILALFIVWQNKYIGLNSYSVQKQEISSAWTAPARNTLARNVSRNDASGTQGVVGGPTPSISIKKASPPRYVIPSSGVVSQTFNNCGPATLSMVMSYFGSTISQDTLREEMRPFNNPSGGVDDKSIFANEFLTYAQKYGFLALHRPNGDIELLKKLVANDIPVVVRTWLHPGEDIGHFRVVRGYDDVNQVLIQDDSYEGKDLQFAYSEFELMWQPFNYGYILVYPKEKEDVVKAILGTYMEEKKAYEIIITKGALRNSEQQAYIHFNEATAYFYLGQYEKAVAAYEKAEQAGLPPRMLWYQIEPIEAYLKSGNTDKVFTMTDAILYNGNLAFSELYFLRGQAYQAQGENELARAAYEKAVYYNNNYQQAQQALGQLE